MGDRASSPVAVVLPAATPKRSAQLVEKPGYRPASPTGSSFNKSEDESAGLFRLGRSEMACLYPVGAFAPADRWDLSTFKTLPLQSEFGVPA